MGDTGHLIIVLFAAAIAIGALSRVVRNPKGANELLSGGVDTFTGILHGLEG